MKKVWIFGDSTSAENLAEPLRYEQAWSHFLRDYLTDDIEYKNVAVGGTTLKNYWLCEAYRNGEIHKNIPQDSRWNEIVSEVENGDIFVFFVGGINDHGQRGADTYYECPNGDYIIDDFYQIFKNRDVFMYVGEGYGTHRFFTLRSSVEEYAEILTQMIEQVKAKGAIPLLARGTGKYYIRNGDNFDVFPASHRYMKALPNLAEKTGIAYFDIGGIFDEGFKNKGYAFMMENYFMTKSAVKRLNQKYGRENGCSFDDNCHHNFEGAKHICDIFVNEIKKSTHPLKDCLK